MKKKSTMATWKARKLVKGQRASRTPGKAKGMIPPTINRTICKRGRSYKMREYASVMQKYDGNKLRWGGK